MAARSRPPRSPTLDIGKATRVLRTRARRKRKRAQEITTYSKRTGTLQVAAGRLIDLGVTRVVMEATSDYWRPALYLLEANGFAALEEAVVGNSTDHHAFRLTVAT